MRPLIPGWTVDLHALRQNSINKIREQLDELSGEQLTQLRALESEEDAPRSTLIKAIDDKLEELGELSTQGSDAATEQPTAEGSEGAAAPASSDAAGEGNEPASSPVAAALEAPAAKPWQAPDYCGPLTGDQALWRNEHLTKPAEVTSAK